MKKVKPGHIIMMMFEYRPLQIRLTAFLTSNFIKIPNSKAGAESWKINIIFYYVKRWTIHILMKTHLLYFFEFEMERPSPRQKSVYQVSLCDKTWNEIINPQTDLL